MFGLQDGFLVPLLSVMRRLPVFPLFGSGDTKLQPVYVEDVAEAVARLLHSPSPERIYELAGPRIYTYRSLLRVVGAGLDKEPVLLPLPFALWKFIGAVGELLPAPPVTRNQVELMERDNIASPSVPGFASLQMVPRSLEEVLPQLSEDRIRAMH
jgi:NADH dehydrogenase